MANTPPFSAQALPASTLMDALLPTDSGRIGVTMRNLVLAIAGSLLLVAAAKIKVPFWPVPMNLQTLAVLGIGAACGARLGAATLALYVAYGLFGLPVFTNTPPMMAGPAYLLGPTGGFLIGFFPMVVIAGWAAERGASLTRLVTGFVIAEVLMFSLGCLWLALGAQMVSGATGLGFSKAFAIGVQPFLLADLLKTALAVTVVKASWSALDRRA